MMDLRLFGVEDGDSSGNSMSWRPHRRACSSRRLRPCPRKASVCNGNQLILKQILFIKILNSVMQKHFESIVFF